MLKFKNSKGVLILDLEMDIFVEVFYFFLMTESPFLILPNTEWDTFNKLKTGNLLFDV